MRRNTWLGYLVSASVILSVACSSVDASTPRPCATTQVLAEWQARRAEYLSNENGLLRERAHYVSPDMMRALIAKRDSFVTRLDSAGRERVRTAQIADSAIGCK